MKVISRQYGGIFLCVLDYSYNPKIMAMSIITAFALACPMLPIYYIVRVAAWPLPLPPCLTLKPAFMQYRRGLPCGGRF